MSSDDGADLVGQGGDESDRRFSPPDWGLSRASVILAAVTLVAGLLAGLAGGYAAGQRHTANSPAPSPRPPISASSATPVVPVSLALTQNTTGCSAQVGRNLQLGVPVTNQSAAPVTLGGVDVTTPLGGLRVISRQWGPCGALPEGQGLFTNVLAPGDSTWLTVTFKVLVKCPGPLPVQFTVRYDVGGQHAVATLPGFADLSQVPYKGCPAS